MKINKKDMSPCSIFHDLNNPDLLHHHRINDNQTRTDPKEFILLIPKNETLSGWIVSKCCNTYTT